MWASSALLSIGSSGTIRGQETITCMMDLILGLTQPKDEVHRCLGQPTTCPSTTFWVRPRTTGRLTGRSARVMVRGKGEAPLRPSGKQLSESSPPSEELREDR